MHLMGAAISVWICAKVFARNLKRLRKATSLSQEKLAFRAGLDRTYIGVAIASWTNVLSGCDRCGRLTDTVILKRNTVSRE
jgi:hypothetical protein